ncbi:EamA family transporter [Enterobacteriaceae bacterium H18W14]|nr:EamA family transporter [Dryocola boscaweniae]MCT4715464.1 EamA family transporter [Dryocola boscaweniae]
MLNAVLGSVGQLAFKAAAVDSLKDKHRSGWLRMVSRPYVWCGIFCYLAEFLLWIAFLSLVPLSAGVMLGSINIVAVMVLGRIIFHEKISLMRSLGIICISLGVAVVGLQG